MNGKLSIDMTTYRRLMSNLAELPRRVALKHFRIALNAWGSVVKAIAVERARKQTGLLKKSLKIKVRIPDASYNIKHHGKPAYVIVGPARDVVGPVSAGRLLSIRKATKLVVSGGKVRTRRPSRYAHLIERGHANRGGTRTPAYPFIGPAQEVGKAAGMNALFDKLQQGLAKEAAALHK